MKLLGIDYGLKRIGVAESNGVYATGLAEFTTNESVVRLKTLCRQRSVELIVIGIPEGRLKEKVKQYGAKLKKELGCDIAYWDETLTSESARHLLVRGGSGPKKRHQLEHQTAAAILLQAFIDAHKYTLHN